MQSINRIITAFWLALIVVSAAFSATLFAADSDFDGFDDSVETNTGIFISGSDTGTDPNNNDTDGDTLLDGQEFFVYGTNPVLSDTDGDGLYDGDEVNIHNTRSA